MGLVTGKKLYDKRQDMAERDAKRDIAKRIKSNKNIKNYKESSRYGLVLFVYLLTMLFLVVDKNTVRIYNVNNKRCL